MDREEKVAMLINYLEEIKDNGFDVETDHIEADNLLLDIITEYGHPEVRKIFDKIGKWYA